MTRKEAFNLSYLTAGAFMKEAAEEEGIDLDAIADELDPEELADALDETVVELAESGALDDVWEDVDEDEFDEDKDLDVEAEGFMNKVAQILVAVDGAMEKQAKKKGKPPIAPKGPSLFSRGVTGTKTNLKKLLRKAQVAAIRHPGKVGAGLGAAALGLGGLGYAFGRRK